MMITSSEYRKRLSKMRRNVYMNGEVIDRDDLYFRAMLRDRHCCCHQCSQVEFRDLHS